MATEKREEATTKESARKEESPRMNTFGRTPKPVVRSYYDPRQNCVMDVIEVTKKVTIHGNTQTVTFHRHVLCSDEELQAKYAKSNGKVDI